MTDTMINIARDFAKTPAGRVPTDGPNSGTRFRDELLVPALLAGGRVIIELDGTRGYGSSFLDEAFGTVVRSGTFSTEEMLDRIELHSQDPSLPLEIRSYFYWPRPGEGQPEGQSVH